MRIYKDDRVLVVGRDWWKTFQRNVNDNEKSTAPIRTIRKSVINNTFSINQINYGSVTYAWDLHRRCGLMLYYLNYVRESTRTSIYNHYGFYRYGDKRYSGDGNILHRRIWWMSAYR